MVVCPLQLVFAKEGDSDSDNIIELDEADLR